MSTQTIAMLLEELDELHAASSRMVSEIKAVRRFWLWLTILNTLLFFINVVRI